MKVTGRRGFTLIELLVVIGIIALLVGILAPMLARAKGSARSILCATNLRGLQTAMTQFAADNAARYGGSLANQWVAQTHWGVWWNDPGNHDYGQVNIAAGDIWQYVQEPALYVCPTAKNASSDPPRGAETMLGVPYGAEYWTVWGKVPEMAMSRLEVARSYSLNGFLGTNIYATDPVTGAITVTVKTNYAVYGHARAIWLAEVHSWRDLVDPQSRGIARVYIGPTETPGQWHKGKGNCSFGDGHVERLSPAEIRANLNPAAP